MLNITGSLEHLGKRLRQAVAKCFEVATRLEICLIFHILLVLNDWQQGRVGVYWIKLCCLQNKKECYYTLCVHMCVFGYDGGGGRDRVTQMKHPICKKNNQCLKMEQRDRQGEIVRRFDLRSRQCISAC